MQEDEGERGDETAGVTGTEGEFKDDIISVASRRVLLLAHQHAPLLTWNLDPRLELELISQCWIRNLNGAEAWPSLPRCPVSLSLLVSPSLSLLPRHRVGKRVVPVRVRLGTQPSLG